MAKKTTTDALNNATPGNAETPKTVNKSTNKVKFVHLYIGTYGYFTPGQIAEVPAKLAESAIDSGVAVGID